MWGFGICGGSFFVSKSGGVEIQFVMVLVVFCFICDGSIEFLVVIFDGTSWGVGFKVAVKVHCLTCFEIVQGVVGNEYL